MSRSCEELLGARRIHRHRNLLSAGLVERRVGERHLRLRARQRRPRPWDVHALRVRDADRADRAGRLVHLPALAGRSEMRLQRSGKRSRRRRDVDDDRALQIQALEVVDLLLGDVQTVSDKNQRRIDRRRRIRAHADVRIVGERERFGFSVAREYEARL